MVRTKVFVGNLSFKTKETELSAEFSAAGKVIGANIITRGPRSLGYGFVEMESEDAAKKAVELLHHKEIDGRQINVEVAREPKEGEEVERKERQPKVPREPREPRERQSTENADGQPKQYRRRGNQKEGQSEESQTGNATQQRRDPKPRGERKPRAEGSQPKAEGERKPREPRAPKAEGERKPREPREPREKRSNVEKVESDVLLFVANLPFSLDSDTFSAFIKSANVAFKQAYVVKKHNNRSKGYGFIEFENREQQQKGLETLNNKEVEGRPISVKIALTQPGGAPVVEGGKEESEQPTTGNAQPKSPAPKASPQVSGDKKTEAPKSPAAKATQSPKVETPKKE